MARFFISVLPGRELAFPGNPRCLSASRAVSTSVPRRRPPPHYSFPWDVRPAREPRARVSAGAAGTGPGAERGSGNRGNRRADRTMACVGGKRVVPLLLCAGGGGGWGCVLAWKGPRARAAGGPVQVRRKRGGGGGGPECTKGD